MEVKKIKKGSKAPWSLRNKEDIKPINKPQISTIIKIVKPKFHAMFDSVFQDNSRDSTMPLPFKIRKYWAKISFPKRKIPGIIKATKPNISTIPTIRPTTPKDII